MPNYSFTLSNWVNNASVGSVTWSSPGNAEYLDAVYTYHSPAISNEQMNYLVGTGPNSIPSWGANEVLTSVVIDIERFASSVNGYDAFVNLVVGGSILTGVNLASASAWPTSLANAQYTFTSDNLATLGITKGSVTSGFGVAFSSLSSGGAAIMYIDQISGTFTTAYMLESLFELPPMIKFHPGVGVKSL